MFSAKDFRKLDDLRKLDKDDLLGLVGLETRRTTADWLIPTLGAFGVGVLVGAGIGLLLAPKPGAELRGDLRNRLQGAQDSLQEGVSSVAASVGVSRSA
ncbi:YtxH domain-containing protein [Myxococcaceae bacterium GXIMD 01537]